MEFPSIEVRYEHLSVEAECEVVEGKALPTLWNSLKRVFLVSILLEVGILLQRTPCNVEFNFCSGWG